MTDIEMMTDDEVRAEADAIRTRITEMQTRYEAVMEEIRFRTPEDPHGTFCPCARCCG